MWLIPFAFGLHFYYICCVLNRTLPKAVMRTFLTILIALFSFVSAFAGTNDNMILFNGTKPWRTVVMVSFDKDDIVLHWSDNTTMNDNMARLMLDLASTEGIDAARIQCVNGIYNDVVRLNGLIPNSTLSIYDICGIKQFETYVADSAMKLDLSQLNTGVYLLKNKNMVVRFVKK